jgi:hypothetical protein
MDRFVTVWNSFAGVAGFRAGLKPVKKFENRDKAVARIWKALQRLNGDANAEDVPAAETANTAPKGAKGERAKGKSGKKDTPAKKAPKARSKATKPANAEAGAPRQDNKKARGIAMLQRKNGATLPEIMEERGWQWHTVRGFMAGAMKKAGYRSNPSGPKEASALIASTPSSIRSFPIRPPRIVVAGFSASGPRLVPHFGEPPSART